MSVLLCPLFGDALQITALPERLHRIFGQTFRLSPLLNYRTDVGPKSVLQHRLGLDQATTLLRSREFLRIHQCGFCITVAAPL